MNPARWTIAPALLAPAAICAPAYAVQYLTVEQAQKALFPGADRLVRADVAITPEVKQRIEQASGVSVRNTAQAAWKAESAGQPAGWFLVDEVVGKHEFITYAVGIDPDGSVRGIEILDYRETYGGQVRDPAWRRQFTGKKFGAALKLDQDIRNVSGATLSCRNVTDGVKRLLALHEFALR
jgi:Na+-translocating ferredoxin:NAD+ oxidoreductase RnfG subunit